MIDQLAERYREEEKRLKTVRLLSWCSVSRDINLVGVDCDLLTPRAVVDLNLAGNKILCGGVPTVADSAAYIWRVSKAYLTGNGWRAKKRQKKVIWKVYKAGPLKSVTAAYDHMAEPFCEMPRSGSVSKRSEKDRFPDIDGMVGAVEECAARYGQDPAIVFDWPLIRVFQLQKALRLATIPDYKLRQPETLMEIRREFLKNLSNE